MRIMWILISGTLLGTALLGTAKATEPESKALLEAARKGDLETIEKLLDKGVPVNSRSRYGATPLSFACDKGYVEIVKVLLDHGADPNVQDSFYKATPSYWAGLRDHFDILELLVKAGANVEKHLIRTAAEKGHEGFVTAILAKIEFDEEELSQALGAAQQADMEGIAGLLTRAGAKPPKNTLALSIEVLDRYSGTFWNSELDVEISFRPEEGNLIGLIPGQPEITYAPKDDTTFESVEFPGITIIFVEPEDATTISKITLKQGSQEFGFERIVNISAASLALDPEVDRSIEIRSVRTAEPRNWPSFRGAFASGVADGQNPPVCWNAEEGQHIRFKTPILGFGHSSPIVWGDRVILTTTLSGDPKTPFRHGQFGDVDSVDDPTSHEWMVIALDRKNGKIVWKQTAHRGVPKIRRHIKGSHASCTPATDGKNIVVNFAGEGLYCYSMEGDLRWKVDVGNLDSGWFYDPDYQWGFASSPVIFEDLAIVQADIQGESFIAAFGLSDGKEVWRSSRDEIPSWGTPTIVLSEGRAQVVTNSSANIYGQDARTGKELWRLAGNSEVTVGTPVSAHGLIFFTGGYSPFQPIYAVKVTATGDISLDSGKDTNDGVEWSTRRGGTYMPTPLVYGDNLYLLGNSGVLSCYEAKTGNCHYRERVNDGKGGGYTASPVAADGRIYLTSEDGEVNVVEAGPEYRLLASNPMGEVCMATPAICDGMIYIRSTKHLFGVGWKSSE